MPRAVLDRGENLSFLEGDVVAVAQRLLGCELVRVLDGHELRASIVETEAYHQSDAASHSFKGETPRTSVMFGPPGRVYVYFTYGMHYCMNIVTGVVGEGSAVLIRAIEPLDGLAIMERNRKGLSGVQVSNGPAKACQALGVDKSLNGHALHEPPLQLKVRPALKPHTIVAATRIGISKDVHRLWRFYCKGNPFVSRP